MDIKPGGTVTLGGMRNKPVIYGQQVDASQAMTASEINVTTVVKTGQPILTFVVKDQKELQVHCDTGQTLIWDTAFLDGATKITAGEGSHELKFSAGTPSEI